MGTRKVCPADQHSLHDQYQEQATEGSEPRARDHPATQHHPPPSHRLHAKQQTRAPSASLVPTLSTRTRRLLWCFVLVYQLVNAFLLACMSAMYGTVGRRGTLLWFLRYNFLFSKVQIFLSSVHGYVSAGYALLSFVFAHGAMKMLWYSAKRRRLCYEPASSSSPSPSGSSPSLRANVHKSVLHGVLGAFKRLADVYLSFGMRGKYFTVGFFIREVIESSLQTTQAYNSSRSLSNTFVNQSYGVLIFLNCFACILLPQLYRANMAKGRLVCVLVDLTLDFAWGTAIPLVVFWPYLQMFYDFQNDAYVPVAIENVQKEVEFILVMSTSDFVLSTFPFMSSAANMRGIKRLLSSETPTAVPAAADLVETATAADDASIPSFLEQVCIGKAGCRTFCRRLLHGLFLLHGVVILIISVASLSHASSSASSSEVSLYECLHRMTPWLSTKEACVGRVVNCAAAGINGSHDEIREALQLYDETSLSNLVFTDCPSLEIPSEIHAFSQLTVLTVRQSNVREWPADAAMTSEFFDSLQTIRVASVTFEDAPMGLLEHSLPASVEFVSMRDVDMNQYIHEIGDNWSRLKYFYCDACNLTAFPSIVDSMSGLLELSLLSNDIDVMEDRHVGHLIELENLWIDNSLRLSAFPDSLWRMSSRLGEFSFQNTNISEIPAFVDAIVGKNLQLYAFGTPLCANEVDAGRRGYLSCAEVAF